MSCSKPCPVSFCFNIETNCCFFSWETRRNTRPVWSGLIVNIYYLCFFVFIKHTELSEIMPYRSTTYKRKLLFYPFSELPFRSSPTLITDWKEHSRTIWNKDITYYNYHINPFCPTSETTQRHWPLGFLINWTAKCAKEKKREICFPLFSHIRVHTSKTTPKVALLFHRYSFQFRNRRQTEDPSICLSRSILHPLPCSLPPWTTSAGHLSIPVEVSEWEALAGDRWKEGEWGQWAYPFPGAPLLSLL